MPNHNSKSQKTGQVTPDKGKSTLSTPPESITLDKYHILYIIRDLLQRPKGTSWQDVTIPLAIFVGTLLTLLTVTSFSDFLGIGAPIWQAAFCIIAFGSFIATIIQLVRCIKFMRNNPQQTAEEVYDEITTKIERDWARLNKIALPKDAGQTPDKPTG